MKIFNDASFSFQLLHAMSYTPYHGADIGECLATAEQIEECDFVSWFTAWNKTAVRLENEAKKSLVAWD